MDVAVIGVSLLLPPPPQAVKAKTTKSNKNVENLNVVLKYSPKTISLAMNEASLPSPIIDLFPYLY